MYSTVHTKGEREEKTFLAKGAREERWKKKKTLPKCSSFSFLLIPSVGMYAQYTVLYVRLSLLAEKDKENFLMAFLSRLLVQVPPTHLTCTVVLYHMHYPHATPFEKWAQSTIKYVMHAIIHLKSLSRRVLLIRGHFNETL